MKKALRQGFKETLAKAFELVVQAANKGIKSAFFCFLQFALMNLIHQKNLGTMPMKSFDRLSHSDTFMNALVDKLHRQPAVAQDASKATDPVASIKIKDGAEKKDEEVIDQLP